ncbi:hypothetical protein TWF569_004025 [Orbilia oligospora]|uniref:Uncharacterized protein n=1 Tax=Orbilia oligospora TaxID=2813651 RepID=A0A7C8NE56_ORBOL|nr:hypothetical protein TWF103_011922 [Orbilia oligospora]KAF3094160.1 hypothetical protein TWF102_007666 [Orbilia oligospora]KAF3157121.1 hypothetical protein TWF569_004025 [Orbilia oligospora]
MACALQVGDAAVRLEGAVMMAHVLSAGKLAAQLEAPAELHGNVVETAVFRIPLSAARVMVTIATWAISVAELGIASYQVENAAEITEPAAPDIDASIAAEPSSRGDSVSNSPSTRTPITTPAPDPTTPPSVEYRWFTTTIYWYYYWYYYVWVSTIDYTSTRSSRTSTSTTVSAYVSAFSAASRSFESIASDLTTSTPSQYTTEFEGPTPTPVEAATSSEASTATPAPSNTGGSNSPGNDITNVGGGGGDNAPSTASQYRARDVLVFAPIVFLLTLIYML